MTSVSCSYAVDIAVSPPEKLFFHRHSCTELIFIQRGTGLVWTEKKYAAYHSGQFIVYQPGPEHADKATEDGMQFCLGIQGFAAQCLMPGVFRATPAIQDIVRKIHGQLAESESRWKSLDMDILAGMLAMQIRHDAAGSVPALEPETSDVYEKIKRELDTHIDSAYTLDQLANKIFVSKSYMRKLFKKKYGEAPLAYLLRKKLDLAEDLLRMTTSPIQEIAMRVGIDNPFYFSRLFMRKKGMSPSTYRKKHLRPID